jgi:hypothetical protein
MDYTKLHQHYLAIMAMDGLTLGSKMSMIQAIVGQLPGSGWYVKGATIDALKTIAANDYKTCKGVVRGHLSKRHDTYKSLAENIISDAQEWFDFIMENTTTYLCTKAENGKHGTAHWSRMIEFTDRPDWLLETVKVGYAYRVAEREWIREFYSNLPCASS